MSSPTHVPNPIPGPNTRRPAKLRIANPDSSDEDVSKANQTARREELFQRARMSQDSQRGPLGRTGSSGSGSNGQGQYVQIQSPDVASPLVAVAPGRSLSSPTVSGARLPDLNPSSNGDGITNSNSGYFAPQRGQSLGVTTSSAGPSFDQGRPPPPPPPPPNLTGRDLDSWKAIAHATGYTSPTVPLSKGSPPLRPLPRPQAHAVQTQPYPPTTTSATASSSPSSSSLPPISPGSPLSLSMQFTSVSTAPSTDPSPQAPTPPPKSASWRTGPRPPSPLRVSNPLVPPPHSSSPLGLALSTQCQQGPSTSFASQPARSRDSRSSQGDRRSMDMESMSTTVYKQPSFQTSPPLQYPVHPPIGRVTLLATTDGHKFASADVTGSTSSAAIREKIFTALEIPDDEQPAFLLRRHAMGGGSAQMEAPLEGDALYQYCAESGEPIKGVLAVMSFEQSHPSMPFMPPPIPAPSSNQAKSVRSDEYSNSGRYRRPTSHSETASSMSDLNVLDESESWRASQQQSSAGAYPSSTSETSISTTDMDHLINASGSGPSSLKRKPHQRRSSHLFAGPGGPRRPSSPGGSRRPDNLDGTSMSALSSPNSPPVHLLSPESTLGVDPSQYTRLGSVTPTRPMSADQSTSRSRPTSMSPDEIQHITSTTSIDEQEQILRAIQEDRERDRKMVEEVIRREREEEMAREWERRDREEEEERRRRQIEEDEETAMEEQRKEQELYKASQARLQEQERERLERGAAMLGQTPHPQSVTQRQSPLMSRDGVGPVNEFGDWSQGAGRPTPPLINRSVPVGAGRANSMSSYQDPYRSTQTLAAHRGSDPSDYDSAATMFPSPRYASQSALASQLMSQSARPPLHINVQAPPGQASSHSQRPLQGRSTPHDPYSSSRTPKYAQSPYGAGPQAGIYPPGANAQDLSNRMRQGGGSFTPQPQRTAFDQRSGSIGQSAPSSRNLQQMRSNPNFRGGMPLPGQTRQRPPAMLPQLSSGQIGRQDSLYASGVQAGVRSAPQASGRPSNPNADQMYASVVTSHLPPASLSPPILQGGFSGQATAPYGYDRAPLPPINTYSRNPSPAGQMERSPLQMGPNSPRSPDAPELRTISPRPSTMFDAGQPSTNPSLPRRPSSHYDPPSASHETMSFHAPVVPLARNPNADFTSNQAGPFPDMPPHSAGPQPSVDHRDSLARGHTAHGRFATEGASPPLHPIDLAPPPPYMPSPDLSATLLLPMQSPPLQTSSAPSSPNLARNSAYGGLFDYMVSDSAGATESHSPESIMGGTEIAYITNPDEPLTEATSPYDAIESDGSDESDEDEGGTNALFLPQRPVVVIPPGDSVSGSSTSKPSTAGSDATVGLPHPFVARDASDGEDEVSADSTFTEQMRYLRLDGGDTLRSDESTLGPSTRLSNRSLPPIDTSPAPTPPISSTTGSDPLQTSVPISSASPGWDTPGSDQLAGREAQSSTGNLRRKKTVFEKNEDKNWAFRPPPEQVVRELSRFFPEINLEAEFIEADASPAATTSSSSAASAAAAAAVARETKLKNRKSIRRVAEERQHVSDPPATPTLIPASSLKPPTDVKVVRRRSTRMWDGKVEEVKPSALKDALTAEDDVYEGTPTFKWVKGDLIGKGAYGRVYLGLNAKTGEMLAVKQVEVPSTISDRVDDRQSQVITALRSEIQLLKDLDHPNVVQYLGFEESADFISIFLEYVPGGSLGSVFRKYGKLQEAEVRWFTRQILDGLEYLHGKGILHRDLKGDNILVDPNNNGVVKITDFGVSKQTLEEATQMGGTLMTGSLYWMAPEVVTNAGRGYNSKIDLWSLGCVVLEMLSGSRPWQGLEMMPIILKLGHGERPPMPADLVLSPAAADFVYERSFAVDRDERFSATEALQHEFVHLDPAWIWSRDSELARKVKPSAAGAGRGRRKKEGIHS